jgi:hypothetical protein
MARLFFNSMLVKAKQPVQKHLVRRKAGSVLQIL